MAFSKSVQKGQIPLSCQLCEESNEIKWKCLQCDFLLCTKCQKLHKKVKYADQHTIIDIKDIASNQQHVEENPDFNNILCQIHSGQSCCLFCQPCNEVVCPSCIAKTHNKHNMIELAEGYKLATEAIQTFDVELDTQFVDRMKGISELHSLKSLEELKYEKEKNKILSRQKCLKDEVQKHTNNLLKELDQKKEHLQKSVCNEEIKSQKINKDLEIRKSRLTKALHSVNTSEVFSTFIQEQTARKQRIEPIKRHFKRLPRYIPGKLQTQKALHGELTESIDEQYEVTVIKQYNTELEFVEKLVCCDDGSLWISYSKGKIIQHIKMFNELVHVLREIHIFVGDMALLKARDLLLSTAESNLILLSDTTQTISCSKYSVAPLITGPIHVTLDNKIIIRARKEGPVFPANGPRQVIVMDIEGRKEKVFDLGNDGKPIFSAPQRITTDTDNNIYVIDRLNEDYSGRIVALDKTYGMKWVYSGTVELKKLIFKPTDFVISKLNNIIVVESPNHMIEIINTSGRCIHYLNTNLRLGIEFPFSLDVDNAGTLYIGCNSKKQLQRAKAKIYVVELFGC